MSIMEVWDSWMLGMERTKVLKIVENLSDMLLGNLGNLRENYFPMTNKNSKLMGIFLD